MNNLFRKFNPKPNQQPCLTIIGVGPGDPSLLTLAAVKAIKKARIVAYPVSNKGGESMAANIVSKFIKGKRRLPLEFPMVFDSNLLLNSWSNATSRIVEALEENHEVVFLSQGDVSLYSTSAYVVFDLKLNYPQYGLKVIPGINSFSAAAAIGCYPLSLQKEQLLIATSPDNKEDLNLIIDDAIVSNRVIVFLKLGSRWKWIREVLDDRMLLEKTLFAESIGSPEQIITMAQNVPASSRSYFSLLIIRNSLPDIMP